jgi:hypothetical protein
LFDEPILAHIKSLGVTPLWTVDFSLNLFLSTFAIGFCRVRFTIGSRL